MNVYTLYMRNAYALLGLAFLIVFGSAYLLFERAEAPSADQTNLLDNQNTETMSLSLTSSAFEDNGLIPSEFTCDGENINPPLLIEGVPDEAESLVLVMDDPDIPVEVKNSAGIEKFDHWAVYNLPADTKEIKPGVLIGNLGENSRGEAAYTGPCPPPQYEPAEHRYVFRLYALSGQLNFIKTPALDELEAAAKSSAVASAELTGRYSRK